MRRAKAEYTIFLVQDTSTIPTGVNFNGYIAGYDNTGAGFLRAPDGTVATFVPPGSTLTFVDGLNNSEEISGWYQGNSTEAGFVRTADGTITSFNPPGSVFTFANGINDEGTVTGSWDDGQN